MTLSSTAILFVSMLIVASLATAVYASAMNNSSDNYAAEESVLPSNDSGMLHCFIPNFHLIEHSSNLPLFSYV
jgi:hypothetical protein